MCSVKGGDSKGGAGRPETPFNGPFWDEVAKSEIQNVQRHAIFDSELGTSACLDELCTTMTNSH